MWKLQLLNKGKSSKQMCVMGDEVTHIDNAFLGGEEGNTGHIDNL